MDFSYSDDDERFRADLRVFLAEHHPGRPPKGRAEALAYARAWAATLEDHGYAGPAWPREYGGMDLSLTRQVVYYEEMTEAHVPGLPGNGTIVAPTIIRHGTQTQKDRYLRPLLRAEEIWCQGFSEPDAGSDLPALRTTAIRRGDRYVVNGQKLWTTSLTIAQWMFALVRTGNVEDRAKGITYLLIDMSSSGLSTRSLRDISGGSHFGEVFFEDVEVPVEQRVGEENEGWSIARTSLGHERATAFVALAFRYRRVVDEVHRMAREIGRADDPLIRQRLAWMESAVRIVRLNGIRGLSHVLQTGEPSKSASADRLFATLFEQQLHEFVIDLLGVRGLLTRSNPQAQQRGKWLNGFLFTRASTIGAGTAEIQRNTIAEQTLGLPREPATAEGSI